MDITKVEIKRIIGPTPSGAAVLLGNEEKTFVIFVGFYEAAALIREMNRETPARPLTHELIQNVFLGFDIEVKQIVVSSIIENTFCATLTLQQKVKDDKGEWVGRRNEVRIDARPSDCLVLALKNKVPIFVASEVFESVQDVSKMTQDVESNLTGMPMGELEFEPTGEGGAEPLARRGSPSDEDDDDDDDEESFLGAGPADDDDDDDDVEDDDDDLEGFGGFKP